MPDLPQAIGQLRERPNTSLVQCSAHVQVHPAAERYDEDVFVIDPLIYSTKKLGSSCADVAEPRSLAPATHGYMDTNREKSWRAFRARPRAQPTCRP